MVTDVIPLCQELVRIPSVNPEGITGTDPAHTGEGHLARHLAKLCARLGADVRIEDVQPGRPNLIARFPTRNPPKNRVLLAPHLDTVGVAGMSIDPFGGEIRDDRLWGRGATDTKGTMAAMLAAIASLKNDLPGFATEVTFAAFMGEETGQPGSIAFAKSLKPGDYDIAVIGEPTGLELVHATLGCTWIDLVTTGRAAHASRPDDGMNALLSAAAITLDLAGDFRRGIESAHADPLLGFPTINPGQMVAGSRPNIVPDRATLTLDLRTTPSLHDADTLAVLKSHLESRFGGQKWHLYQHFDCAPMHTPVDTPGLKHLKNATGSALAIAPWFCDAAHLAAAGIPSVAAGPGNIAQAHTHDEWIGLDDLEAGIVFYRSWLESLADGIL